MKLYLGTNSDGSDIISKRPIKRFYDTKVNQHDVFSYNDTLRTPHWKLDYDGIHVPKTGDAPIDVYLTLPKGSIEKMFGISLTWEDDFKTVEL